MPQVSLDVDRRHIPQRRCSDEDYSEKEERREIGGRGREGMDDCVAIRWPFADLREEGGVSPSGSRCGSHHSNSNIAKP